MTVACGGWRRLQKQRHEAGAHAAATAVVSSLGALGSRTASVDSLTSLSTTSTGAPPMRHCAHSRTPGAWADALTAAPARPQH